MISTIRLRKTLHSVNWLVTNLSKATMWKSNICLSQIAPNKFGEYSEILANVRQSWL